MPKLLLARLAAVLVAAFALASSADAQTRKATAQETKLIRDCVEKKGGTDKDNQCIGLVATRCLKKPGGNANLNRADCYRVEQEIWNVVLAAKYKELESDLDDDQKAKLKEMQAAWIAARDATCDFYYHKTDGGSMSVPMTANCYLGETAKRALLLITFSGL